MNLRPVRTESDYEKALERIDILMDLNPEMGTPSSDELEILVLLVEKYEEKHWKIDTPDPIEAIKYRMQEMGLKQKRSYPIIRNKK